MKNLIIFLTLSLSSNSFPVSEEIILSKILADTTSQLKQLKEIMDFQKGTFEEVEKLNSEVQGVKYRVLRAKYLVESTKSLSQTNTLKSQEVLNLMRGIKNIHGNSKSFLKETDEWITDLTKEEREEILEQISRAESDVKTLEENIAQRKVLLHGRKAIQNKSFQDQESINQGLSKLIDENDRSSSEDMTAQQASIQSARNSALTNKLLLNQISVDSEILKEAQEINHKLEQAKIDKLEETRKQEALWKIR